MGVLRSTYYDAPVGKADEAEIVARIKAICEEFETYGYRRVGAELRHEGIVVNAKKVRRLMCEHNLQPRRRKRFVATTDSDHDGPIFPNLARDVVPTGANRLWVADITYVAIAVGFVYVAVILDAWSRRVVGYAISRSIDARLALAALQAAIRSRRPPEGCIHHSDSEVLIAALTEASIAAPIVSNDQRSRRDGALDEPTERLGATVEHDGEPNASGIASVFPVVELGARLSMTHLDGTGDGNLVVNTTAFPTRSPANPGFVHLNMVLGLSTDPVLVGPHHARAELVENLKGRLVARKTKLPLKLHGGHAGV